MSAFPDRFDLSPADAARLRRLANRNGYVVRKSRWRYDSIDNHGGYMLVDQSTNFAVAGSRYDLTGADVAEAIAELGTL
jgi:hypothetical protein